MMYETTTERHEKRVSRRCEHHDCAEKATRWFLFRDPGRHLSLDRVTRDRSDACRVDDRSAYSIILAMCDVHRPIEWLERSGERA